MSQSLSCLSPAQIYESFMARFNHYRELRRIEGEKLAELQNEIREFGLLLNANACRSRSATFSDPDRRSHDPLF